MLGASSREGQLWYTGSGVTVRINIMNYLAILQNFFAKQATTIDVGKVSVLPVNIADVAWASLFSSSFVLLEKRVTSLTMMCPQCSDASWASLPKVGVGAGNIHVPKGHQFLTVQMFYTSPSVCSCFCLNCIKRSLFAKDSHTCDCNRACVSWTLFPGKQNAGTRNEK